jgi:hypothetical protein
LDPPDDWSLDSFSWRLFHRNNKSYTAVSKFNYLIEQRNNPAELKTLKIEALLNSVDGGTENNIPVIFLLDFQ